MRIFIKFAQPALCALLLLGTAQSAAANEPQAPQKDPSRVSGFTSWHDGSTGGAYGIGEGWSLAIFPPTYETVTEDITISHPPQITATPATFEWVKEDSEDLKAYLKTVTKKVLVPAEFETITEHVEVQPATIEYVHIEPRFSSARKLETPGRIKAKHVPAIMRDVTRTVIITPGRTETRFDPNPSLERKDGYARIVKTPAITTVRKRPDTVNTVSRREVKHRERFVVRRPDGLAAHIYDNFEDLTAFVDSLK